MGREEEKQEGVDPTEEVGPEECDPKTSSCELSSENLTEVADGSVPKFSEEIADAYQPEDSIMVPSLVDGLPVPSDETSELAIAPPFTFDHVVCVEDDREYVEIFGQELDKITAVLRVFYDNRYGLVRRSKYDGNGFEKPRFVFDPSRVKLLWGFKVVQLQTDETQMLEANETHGDDPLFVLVRPRRERCKHYMRQVFSNDAQLDENQVGSRIVFRNCMIRRSVGGAFLSLRDEAIFACDYRDPPDEASVKKYLDDPDRDRLRNEAHKKKLPLFGDGIFRG